MDPFDEDRLALPVTRDALSQLLAKRGESRLEAILDAEDPKALVQAMVPIEAFYTFTQLDGDGKRTLVRLLSDEQLDHLLDLDLWSGDRLDAQRVMAWLELIWAADNDIAVNWMLRTESELVVSSLKLLCTVSEGPFASDDSLTERQDQLPPFTAEGKLYVRFLSERAAALLKGPLILLAGTDLEYYLSLLQDVMVISSSEVEEVAYSKRWRRLRDHGIVPPEEAYEIYRWPQHEEERFTHLEVEPSDTVEVDHGGTPTALALAEPQGLLAATIEPFDETQRLELSRAVAMMGSRVLSADHLSFSDLDAHRVALEKTLGYINIGLHDIARADVGIAGKALLQQGASSLFRHGFAKVAALGQRAFVLRRQGWLSQLGLGLEVLDEPFGDVVRSLARLRPLYPALALDSEGADREFRNPEEVERCSEALTTVETLKRVFIDGLGLDLAPAQTFDLTGCIPQDPTELTLGLILRTAIAQMLLGDRLLYAPIPTTSLEKLSRALTIVDDNAEQHVVSSLCSRLDELSNEELRHITSFVEINTNTLVTTFSGVRPTESIDPRFVGAVVIHNV